MRGPTFIFCKRCGAVTRPGICTTCGFDHNAPERAENALSKDASFDGERTDTVSSENILSDTISSENELSDMNVSQEDTMTSAVTSENMDADEKNATLEEKKDENDVIELKKEDVKKALNNQKKANDNKKKTNPWVYIIGIGAPVLFVLICITIVFFSIVVPFVNEVVKETKRLAANNASSQVVSESASEEKEDDDAESESDILDGDEDKGLYGEREIARVSIPDSFDFSKYSQNAETYSDTTNMKQCPFFANGYSNSFGSDHTNVSKDSMTPPYILKFEECIDTGCEYQLVPHYLNYKDKVKGIDVSASILYYQIESDEIPNLEELNRQIYYLTCNELFSYLAYGSNYSEYSNISFSTDSICTYNDDDKLSILLDVVVNVDLTDYDGTQYPSNQESYICAINADVVQGRILDNNRMINTDEAYAKLFRQRCCDQNGYDIQALNDMSDKTLSQFLSSPNSSVFFFTPLGLEVGYLYRGSGGTGMFTGWMTITMMDYMDYILDDYRDLFEGKEERIESSEESGQMGTGEEPSEEEESEENSQEDESFITSSEKSSASGSNVF